MKFKIGDKFLLKRDESYLCKIININNNYITIYWTRNNTYYSIKDYNIFIFEDLLKNNNIKSIKPIDNNLICKKSL